MRTLYAAAVLIFEHLFFAFSWEILVCKKKILKVRQKFAETEKKILSFSNLKERIHITRAVTNLELRL